MAPKNCILSLKAMGDGGHNTYTLRRVAFTGSTIRAPGRVDKIVVPVSLSIQMTSFFPWFRYRPSSALSHFKLCKKFSLQYLREHSKLILTYK